MGLSVSAPVTPCVTTKCLTPNLHLLILATIFKIYSAILTLLLVGKFSFFCDEYHCARRCIFCIGGFIEKTGCQVALVF